VRCSRIKSSVQSNGKSLENSGRIADDRPINRPTDNIQEAFDLNKPNSEEKKSTLQKEEVCNIIS